MLNIKIMNNCEQLDRVRHEWRALIDEMGENVSIFSSVTWYECWWRMFSNRAQFHVLTAWDKNKLVGFAPLMVHKLSVHGLPVKLMGFIENRNSLHNDFVVLPTHREQFLREVLRILFEQADIWDIIVFNNLPELSDNHGSLVKILNDTGMKWQKGTSFNSPYLILDGSWIDYLASRTTRTRKSLRNIQNTIAKTGEVSVRNIRTWLEFQQVRDEIYHVAKQSWTETIGDSLATPVNEAFFDELALRAAAEGWLSVWTLNLNGRMIAFEFHLKGCDKDHAMRGSYLPEFASLSPGTFLEMQILKNAFDEPEKVRRYDFGGSFDSYKRKWTDEAVPHCVITIFNDNLYSRFVAFHETISVPLAKRIRDAFKKVRA
jgi:CelD/BcsL family acetyltransferase involved in cellulose biosynthesis